MNYLYLYRNNYKTFKSKDLLVVFSFFLLLFLMIMYLLKENSDLPAHVKIANEMYENGKLFSGNFILYLMINIFSFFSGDIDLMNNVLCVVLALATTIKYYIVKEYLSNYLSYKTAIFISLSLLIIYIVPFFSFLKVFGVFQNTNDMYIGYYVPNVWHNSTIIFLFPFAILLYLLSKEQLISFSVKRNYLISVLVVLNIFIKPSFFFAFIVAYSFLLLIKYGFRIFFKLIFLPLLSGLVSLFIVYTTIYNSNDGSSVLISFSRILDFDFWFHNSKYLIVSLFLPLLFCLIYYKRIKKDIEFYYLLSLFVVSVGIFYMCEEVGPRASHGNFYWQIIISMWLIFFYISKNIFSKSNLSLLNQNIVKSAYILHFIMGLIYITRILVTSNYR